MKKLLSALLLAWAMMPQAEGASFNCTLAKLPTEILICKDDELTIKDEINAKLFSMVRNMLNDNQRKRLNRVERAWIKKRNACGYNHRCISDAYNVHMPELWKLLSHEEAVHFCDSEDGRYLAECNEIRDRIAAEIEGDRTESLRGEKAKLDAIFRQLLDNDAVPGKYILGLQTEWEARAERTHEEYNNMTTVLCTVAKEQRVVIAECL